ncbi:MAG: NAD(P)-binding domain-containing protein [Pseudomonadota bacterium]|nr:NAD(P)-binding domain-containing protein [Pseudomonadota bacterium]
MKVAIIGLGEVGACYAAPLAELGFDLECCDPAPRDGAVALAQRLSCPIHTAPGDWLDTCEVVLSCVTGRASEAVSETWLPLMRAGGVYADLTTALPETKRRAAGTAAGYGVSYADVAIMGPISVTGPQTPLLAAGEGAAKFRDLFARFDGPVEVLDVAAGGAIALKLLRSVFTKGLEALCIEMVLSAEKQGVRENLFERFSDMDDIPMKSLLSLLVRTHPTHAARRLHEVDDAAAHMTAQGVPSLTLPGVRDRFQATVRALERTPPPSSEMSFDEALAWLTDPGATA